MGFKKISAALMAAAVIAVAVPITEVLPDMPGLMASADTYDSNGLQIEDGELISVEGDPTELVIPNGVTKINSRAFQNCENLKSLTIPSSVTRFNFDRNI